ncbi:exodeoxyribonuclease VII small subunit [Trueperella sp. LYQ143]|uniref:exodeoxyribonuclease VII small subunit n=1 Tax=unclassified Trueperella TaxID=2630174 RepID=UPI0039831EF3
MSTPQSAIRTPDELDAEVAALSYEEARSQLAGIVAILDQGNLSLDEAIAQWERGEALARRCEAWLDSARQRLQAAQDRARITSAGALDTSDHSAESSGNGNTSPISNGHAPDSPSKTPTQSSASNHPHNFATPESQGEGLS